MLGNRADGGVFALDGGVPRAIASAAARDLLLVPAEQVLTLSVALPLPSHAKRLAALPFAVEDRIVDRVDAVHLVLGAPLAAGGYAAGVVDRDRMAGWVGAAEAAGLADAAIMPDALALPLPEAGHWHVKREGGGRILVRTAEGAGFAADEKLFVALWTAAGKPACDEVDFAPVVTIGLDLRQGDFAPARQGLSATGRRVAIVAAAGLLAHGAIAAADTYALRSVAAKQGAELTGLLATAAPGRYAGDDPHEAAMIAAELLPAGGAVPPGALLPLMSRTSQALAPFGAAIVVRSLGFDETDRSLRFDLDLADPAAGASIGRALAAAGLAGRFEGKTLVVRNGGGA